MNKNAGKQENADIIIAGGGAAGLCLAALLGRAGLKVALIEKRDFGGMDKAPQGGRTIALMNASLNIIKAAGAWEGCAEDSAPLECMRIIDNSAPDSPDIPVDFDACDIGLAHYGYNVPALSLSRALLASVRAMPCVQLYSPAVLTDYEAGPCGVTAMLEDGRKLHAPLIVGADGAESHVRTLAGIGCKRVNYGQSALTFLINHSLPHGNTSTEFHKPGGPLALVPLPGHKSAVVWVEAAAEAEKLLSLPETGLLDVLDKKTQSLLGGMTLETRPESWPLRSVRAEKLTAPRAALIAEAAHVMSPITAQGLNLSLRDVAALAETIMDARRTGLDTGSAAILTRYERRRQADIKTRVFGVHTLNTLVRSDIAPVKRLRRRTLGIIDALSPLKTAAMRQGLAPAADLGRLARGEVL
jgi:2-octaprenyl-6-methoxyphenol hydroxylase